MLEVSASPKEFGFGDCHPILFLLLSTTYCLYSLVISVLYGTALDVSVHSLVINALYGTALDVFVHSLVINALYGTALDVSVIWPLVCCVELH